MSKITKKNQTTEILRYLKNHKKKGITSMQAFELYGVTRLSAKIFALRKKGYKIETVIEEGKNRYGDTTKYARYVLLDTE